MLTRRFWLAVLMPLQLVAGCGQASSPASVPPGVTPSLSARSGDGHESARELAASDVAGVTVPLNAGWNALGFQAQELTTLSSNPSVPGFARWTGSGYAAGNLTAGELNAAGGGRTGFFLFATANTSITYSGRDVEGNFLDLAGGGYQLVSFATPIDIPGSSLTAARGGQTVPLSSAVLPQFQEVGTDNALTSVDVTAGGVLKAGRAYWVFAQSPVRLSWSSPAPSPVPTPTVAVVSLNLTPTNATLSVSATLQYTLTARLADGTTRDVTNLATWTSQDPSVAASLGAGLYKGLNAFGTRVKAELAGVSVETDLEVRILPTVGVLPSPSPVPLGHLYLSQNLGAGRVVGFNQSSRLASAVPDTTLDGANTQLAGNGNGLALDVPNNQLYVGVYSARRICSFAPATTATGDLAPTSSFTYTSSAPSMTDGLAFDSRRNRIYIGTSSSVLGFDNARSRVGGSESPSAQITAFGGAMLGLALDEPNDRLFASTLSGTSIAVFDNVSTLAGTATRAAAVSRTVTSVPAAGGMFVDSTRQRLYLVQTGSTNRIHVYTNIGSPSFSGAVAPTATVTVPTANFGSVCYVSVDTANDQLFVRGASTLYVVDKPSEWSGSITVPILKQFGGFTNLFGVLVDSTRD